MQILRPNILFQNSSSRDELQFFCSSKWKKQGHAVFKGREVKRSSIRKSMNIMFKQKLTVISI